MRPGRPRATCLPHLLLALTLLLAPPAPAQPSHGAPTLTERPLHARLALADAVVAGRVEDVETGRIQVTVVAPILGQPPDSLELKRAPSRPPPLRAGEVALLILRGARSPYVLVDAPEELVALDGEAALARWRRALRALDRAAGRPAEITRVYAGWLDDESVGLRKAAVVGLGDPESTLPPLGERESALMAALAVDPDLPPLVRLRAAGSALQTGAGRDALIARLPGDSGADARVLAIAVQTALREGVDVQPALSRSLAQASAMIRVTAARLCALAPQGAELRAQLAGVAAGDVDEGVRTAAARALGK